MEAVWSGQTSHARVHGGAPKEGARAAVCGQPSRNRGEYQLDASAISWDSRESLDLGHFLMFWINNFSSILDKVLLPIL